MPRLAELPLRIRLRTPHVATSLGRRVRSRAGRIGLGAVACLFVATSASAWDVTLGDTLSEIARRTGTTVQALVDANDIEDPDRIYVGQSLVIPDDDGSGSDGEQGDSGDHAGDDGDAGGRPAPTATVPAIGPTGDPSDERTHVVERGDSVASIAKAFGIPPEQFLAANGMTSRAQLMLGARVQAATAAPAPGTDVAGDQRVTVRTGDTLGAIARRTGSSVADLVAANDIADPNRIHTGQVVTVPGSGSGGFACPVPGARFTHDWGIPKPGGQRFHEGIDLYAPTGTTILAPASGVVERRDGSRGGVQFKLTDDAGYVHWGSHLDTLATTGRVQAGDVIGTVGTTGNARGGPPHLHYGVRHSGRLVNPYPSLVATC